MRDDDGRIMVMLDNQRLVRMFLEQYPEHHAPGFAHFRAFLEALRDRGLHGCAAQYVLLCHAQGAAEDVYGLMAITQHLAALPAVSGAIALVVESERGEAN